MNECPYCQGEVSEAALACRHCGRDLALVRSLMGRIAELEARLPSGSEADVPVADELGAAALLSAMPAPRPFERAGEYVVEGFKYILQPLCLLLMAHALITVVYDLNLVYLRLISIAVPLPFGFFLFRQRKSMMLPWFLGIVFLAMGSVLGMSAITGMVDGTPVLPQDAFEWRELVEYAASITFSFLTGMLLGALGGGRVSKDNLRIVLSDVKTFGSALAALLTSCVSIYTGLKGLFGG